MTYKPVMLTDRFDSCTISLTVSLSQFTFEPDPNKIPHKICFNMSKQNEIKDFPHNSRRAQKVAIMNIGNSIALDPYNYSKNPYIRTKVLRIIGLKFHYSFRVKLFMYRLFERSLSMAETTVLQVRNTTILSP